MGTDPRTPRGSLGGGTPRSFRGAAWGGSRWKGVLGLPGPRGTGREALQANHKWKGTATPVSIPSFSAKCAFPFLITSLFKVF